MLKTFQYFTTTISYTIEGSGEPVVLLHGFGEDSSVWDRQLEYLKEKFLVIVPDIPGSGRSSMLEGLSQAITLGDYAVCIHALLLHEKITGCFIFGHSMGGYITLAFTELYPNVVKGFGLVHSSSYADTEEKKQNRARGIEMMEKYGAHAFLKSIIPGLFGSRFREENSARVQELVDDAAAFSAAACQQYYTAMMNRPDRQAALKNAKEPVLIIAGTEDPVVNLQDALDQAQLPAISYIHVLEGVGHMGMLEAPEDVNRYLEAFISQHIEVSAE